MVDDGSSLGIDAFIRERFSEDKVRYVRNSVRLGLSGALNLGLREAKGKYIVFLDDDDLLHPTMVSRSVAMMVKEKADLVAVQFQYFSDSPSKKITNHYQDYPSPEKILKTLTQGNIFRMNGLLFNKHLAIQVGGFDDKMVAAEDWDLWLRMVVAGARVATIPDVLAYIRIHSSNISRDEINMHEGCLRVLQKAEGYFSGDLQNEIGLRSQLAFRYFVTGWYAIVGGDRKKGRGYLHRSMKTRSTFFFPWLLFLILSYFPQKLVLMMGRALEFLFKRENLYRT